MKKKKTILMNLIMIITGNFIDAAGFTLFVAPGGLITGGTSGLGLFVNRNTGLPVSTFVFIFNIFMFILGFFLLGKKFAASTAVSSFFYPFALALIEKLSAGHVITHDVILCTVFGGLLIGAGVGLVLRAGASSGGMDVPPLLCKKYFRLPVSTMIYVFDLTILLLQAFFTDSNMVLYGIIQVLIYSIVIDKCLMIGKSMMQVKIVSQHYDEIRQAIFQDVDRGITMIKSQTGYLGKETDMVMTVVSNRELGKVEKIVHGIDPAAFMIVNRVSEVMGRGFSLEKKYK